MRLYAWAVSMDLVCSKGHDHKVREHFVDSPDWRHLLKEFPEYLFKKDPNKEHIRITQSRRTNDVEIDNSSLVATTNPLMEE